MYFRLLRKGLMMALYMLLLFSVFFLYESIVYLRDSVVLLIIILLILLPSFIVLAWHLVFGDFSGKFYIDEEGVKYIKHKKKYSLKWENINSIKLASDSRGRITKNSPICFDGRSVDPNFMYERSNQIGFNELYFGVQYRKRIVIEIRKYWDKQIQGIYHVEGKGRL